jgi:uroporphyrinogen decarboxylase
MTKIDLFMANLNGRHTDRTPIWIMRQAGRYLPQYREYRKAYTFEQLCRTPEAVAEVTAQPVEILDLDAAIIFSDILLILEPMGINLKFDPGPVLSPVLKGPEQIKGLHDFNPSQNLKFVGDSIVLTKKRLGDDIPLLGFCGAPFTLFCYLCGIKGAKDFHKAMKFALSYPDETGALLERLSVISLEYLRMQIRAGADAVQVFDTWAGELAQEEFRCFSLPYLKKIFDGLKKDGAKTSIYIRGTYHLLDDLAKLNADVISIDWRTPLGEAAKRLEPKTIQGNLDPHLLLGKKEIVVERARQILQEMADYPGYIFNLGHGILPETPVENVRTLVEMVHAFDRGKM